jgi:uracil-DNA glycosylase
MDSFLYNVMRKQIKACGNVVCPLHPRHGYAKQVVPGIGNPDPKIMIVGEGPGADEDLNGEPFIGRAGQTLDAVMYAMNLKRSDVYITNIVKCRPPENRNPIMAEMDCCDEWLGLEFSQLRPDLIILLGNTAKNRLVPAMPGINACHGQTVERWLVDTKTKSHPGNSVLDQEPIDMRLVTYMFTYHPSGINMKGGINSEVFNKAVVDFEKLIDKWYDKEKRWRR